ncbi:hypothetical protein TNIN_81181 [Trichonephila inaurata madagascariensis]|uniref:Uncharacterized protein n=1 Tax=Trichonephila inaurata madagascariensis TaxID=2747483 RepID=A0A8X6XVC1_9ARAC|nr:hypothetical protein TNIN_81181 [Trichonephila inaurata madagascariensis]
MWKGLLERSHGILYACGPINSPRDESRYPEGLLPSTPCCFPRCLDDQVVNKLRTLLDLLPLEWSPDLYFHFPNHHRIFALVSYYTGKHSRNHTQKEIRSEPG